MYVVNYEHFWINTVGLFGRVYMDFIRNEELKKHHCVGKWRK